MRKDQILDVAFEVTETVIPSPERVFSRDKLQSTHIEVEQIASESIY